MSKLLLPLVLAASVFAASLAQAQQGLIKIADNVYSYVEVKNASPTNSFAANAGIIIGENGVLAVDALISAKEAKRFIADIRKVTDKPIKYLVNTHYHWDHSFGDSEFAKLGTIIISQKLDARKLAEVGPVMLASGGAKYGLSKEDAEGTEIVAPQITFSDRMGINLGGIEVELIYPGPSHSAGSILVSVPSRKLVFTGDILFTDFHPFLAEGDFEGWIKALDKLNDLGATAIVPGHGPLSNLKEVAEMKEYLIIFDRKAKELAAKGGAPEVMAAELVKALPAKSQGEWLVQANLVMRYLPKQQ